MMRGEAARGCPCNHDLLELQCLHERIGYKLEVGARRFRVALAAMGGEDLDRVSAFTPSVAKAILHAQYLKLRSATNAKDLAGSGRRLRPGGCPARHR